MPNNAKWNLISNTLPPEDTWVLVCDEECDGDIIVVKYTQCQNYDGMIFYSRESSNLSVNEFTHWMFLPEQPNKKNI
jgi:hypothetical protein